MTSPTPRAKGDLAIDLRKRLAPLAGRAVDALRDPEVRAKLKSQGEMGIDAVQRWRAGRSDGPSEGRSLRVVHQRLERREQRLRTAVDGLSDQDPVLRVALGPVVDALDGVTKALTLAEALPLRSRRKAHRSVEGVLDGLDEQLLAATLGLAAPRSPDET